MIQKELKCFFSFLLLTAFTLSYLNIDFSHKSTCSHDHADQDHYHETLEVDIHSDLECSPTCKHDAHLLNDTSCECGDNSIFVEKLFIIQDQTSTHYFVSESVYTNSFDVNISSFKSLNNKSPPFLS